jgi:hypothetical protein
MQNHSLGLYQPKSDPVQRGESWPVIRVTKIVRKFEAKWPGPGNGVATTPQ